jgi:bacteriocin biosynthesis cyclodehydratase domain-containing protein
LFFDTGEGESVSRPCLALPFTFLTAPNQVRLVCGEDFRFTLSGPELDTWLPGWLPRLDGRLTLDEAVALLPSSRQDMARQLVERLVSERVIVPGPVEQAHPAQRYRIEVEGTGALLEALAALAAVSEAPAVRVLCQDRLDIDESLRFNEHALRSGSPWLWASCAAMTRGYVSPVFLPDSGPCLACLFGHFRRLSPLPELYDELAGHVRSGGTIVPSPMPSAGVVILAQLAAWKVSEWLARPEPTPALYRLHVLESRDLEISSHAVRLDPECPACGGRR